MIQDLSGSCCIKGTDDPTLVVESPAPLMHYDPDIMWSADPDPDHPKGTRLPSSQARRPLCHKINVLSCVCLWVLRHLL